MRPLTRWLKSGAFQRPSDDRADGDRAGKAALRGLHADKDAAGCTARAYVGERDHESLADVLREGETVPPAPCASDEQCAGLPIQVISQHGDDFARS